MSLSPNDPRITAAALGELLPEEQAAFDRELAELAEPVRAEIEQELRETASLAARIREVRQAELRAMEANIATSDSDKPAEARRISQDVLAKALAQKDSVTDNGGIFGRGSTDTSSRRRKIRRTGWMITVALAASVMIAVLLMMEGGPAQYFSGDYAALSEAPAKSAGRESSLGYTDNKVEVHPAEIYSGPFIDSTVLKGQFEAQDGGGAIYSPEPTDSSAPGSARMPSSAASAGGGFGGGGTDLPAAAGGRPGGEERPLVYPPSDVRDAITNRRSQSSSVNSDGDRSGGSGSGGGSITSADEGASGQGGQGDGQQAGDDSKEGDNANPSTPAKAEPVTWKRSPLTPNASRLMIGDNQELPLEGMQANVQVDGYRARVLLDLYFYNNGNAIREADFRLRLPPEASLYYFAFGETVYSSPESLTQALGAQPAFFNIERSRQLSLDPKRIIADRGQSWIEPKEARMVQREKAAFAYSETVRRRVDPALVEWAGSGVFTARVFPVQPGKLHRIVVGYDVNLAEEQGDLVYRFAAPYAKQAVLDLRVTRMNDVGVSISPETQAFMDDTQQHYRVENPDQIVELRMSKPGNVLLVGEDGASGTYFSGLFTPELPAVSELKSSPRAGMFLVDTSLSANPDRFNVYLKLMETMLRENRATMPQFAVLFFNAHAHWWKPALLENTDENVAALMAYAQTLALEGATDLSAAAQEALYPEWLESTEKQPLDYFLLSDGAITWGERDAQAVAAMFASGGDPLFAYTTNSAGDDLQTLNALTSATGGAVFSIVAEDQVTKVATAHLGKPWELIGYDMSGGSDVLLAGNPQTLFPGVALQVVGRVPVALGNQLTLQLRRGSEEQTIKVPFKQVVQSDMAPRHYGQVAVAGLEEFVSQTEAMATAYARHFRITGQTCSLLMLESQADYDRFNIKEDDDAFVVTSEPAAPLIEAARAATADLRVNSKADFIAWLRRMEGMPGLEFTVPQSLETMLNSLPDGAFQVRPRPLQPQLTTWDKLPARYQDAELSAEFLNYNEITTEAERRLKAAGPDDALLALSSLIENNPGDYVLLRDIAYSALEFGRADQAFSLFRQVAKARPYEPQTYHALARCAETLGNADLAMLYYEVSIRGTWDARFGEFRQIVGLDYLRLLKQIDAGKMKTSAAAFAASRLNSVNSEFGLGVPELVITMAWNTDNTDVDLHVIDPTGEECYYSHPDTRIGGHLTRDVTQGFGPEMFVLRKAIPGEFKVRANYFASDANREGTRTRVFLRVYRDWGTPEETVNSFAILLTDGKETHDVASVIVK